ncbi:MAG: hydroxyphenylacetyl-CoA thioesterase PaaI [Bacteroidota bacterium]
METPSPMDNVQHMMKEDYFSQWLGIEVLEVKAGSCKLAMTVRREMLNGFGILHGGVSFSLADSAFAFASNSHGRLSVALNNSITYPKAAKEGDTIYAEAIELTLGYKTATYDVVIRNQQDEEIALFRGVVYRTSKTVIPESTA